MSPVHPLSGYEVYVTAQDYLGRLTRGRADAQARELVSRVPRPVLLANLALLNKGQAGVGIERNVWDAVFLDCVEPATRSKLQNLLEGSPAGRGRRRLFFRQGILVAARFVVLNGRDEVDAGTESLHPLGVAGMLVHLLAVELGATAAGTELGPELFRSELFESATPSGDSMALYRRAWVDYETQVAQKVPGIDPPMHLASQALGADVEDVFSLVFALFAQAISSEQDVPPLLSFEQLSAYGSAALEAVVQHFAATPHDMQSHFDTPTGSGPWGLLPFVERPLVAVNDCLLVMDARLLIDRVTVGLYWLVHDDQKRRGGNRARDRWAQAWGVMVEALALDVLRDATLYTTERVVNEGAIQGIYGGKVCDALVLDGRKVALVEVYSGSTTTLTRHAIGAGSLARDLEKMVFDKAEQLDAVASALGRERSTPGGFLPGKPLLTVPVIVHASRFPSNQIVMKDIHKGLRERQLLCGHGVMTLGVISLEELEYLARVARGTRKSVVTLLREWRRDGASSAGFIAFANHRYARHVEWRTPKTASALDELMDTMEQRLPSES